MDVCSISHLSISFTPLCILISSYGIIEKEYSSSTITSIQIALGIISITIATYFSEFFTSKSPINLSGTRKILNSIQIVQKMSSNTLKLFHDRRLNVFVSMSGVNVNCDNK